MIYKIAVIKGDGIGPEIINEGVKVLKKVGEKYNIQFEFTEVLAGGAAIDAVGECLPDETLEICKNSDAVYLGAVGGPKWDDLKGEERPEKALLKLRKELGLFANIRPIIMYDELKDACPLKDEIVQEGLDIVIVRELTGGIYFGERNYSDEYAWDKMGYSKDEVERIAKKAFEIAQKRNKKVTSIDKSNVLDSSRLWRKTVENTNKKYKDIELKHMYVDNGAMQLVVNPKQFDVILTGNMFGDILSDEGSIITGSLGMLPSASLGEGTLGMYEPVHGSAPDIAGQNKANPIAAILSAAMMIKYSFGLIEEGESIEKAVKYALKKGIRSKDIAKKGEKIYGTKEIGDIICQYV
ncbi:MAG: 3-isopropylmalate dehydrogenase [Bacillota bacterium]|nr:3-isopropylmalate dehydrogenase [Bacillota bacterium]